MQIYQVTDYVAHRCPCGIWRVGALPLNSAHCESSNRICHLQQPTSGAVCATQLNPGSVQSMFSAPSVPSSSNSFIQI